MKDLYPVSDLCAAFEVSRAGFYAWRQRGPSQRDLADATLGEQIGTLFARSRCTYGSPRLHRALQRGRPCLRSAPGDAAHAWAGLGGPYAGPSPTLD